jgi:hypothetical protein
MLGETEKKQRRNSGATLDGDDHLPVCILKVMKITPRPNTTGIIMRLGFVKKSVAEEICTPLLYAGPRSDFYSCFRHAICCVTVYLLLHHIYVYAHSMTPHITLYL